MTMNLITPKSKMHFVPRPYQTEAINAGVNFFQSKEAVAPAIEILPTGSGKSVVIANIGKELKGKTIVFQPSKEILEQNYKKFCSYGYRAGIYSASAGVKIIDKVTFATIGSVAKKHHMFKDVENIIMDECHLCNSSEGMYSDFFKANPSARILGLTATPYRLTTGMDGAMLKFLTRTNPRVFTKVLYYIQNDVLFNAGHLARLEYFSFDVIDRTKLTMNASGTDFTEASIKNYYRQINMPAITTKYARKLLAKRKNLLVFCSLISEAQEVQRGLPGSVVLTGETDQFIRASILSKFKAGKIRCVINVGVLTTGFDYPELETVLIARGTMSLALYYQIVGRAMRPHKDKETAWIVDLGGNLNFFGKIETMRIEQNDKGLYFISNNGKQLTNVAFQKK
jgi:DNA repair protein RadD